MWTYGGGALSHLGRAVHFLGAFSHCHLTPQGPALLDTSMVGPGTALNYKVLPGFFLGQGPQR